MDVAIVDGQRAYSLECVMEDHVQKDIEQCTTMLGQYAASWNMITIRHVWLGQTG
jgi:hypothetical protein